MLNREVLDLEEHSSALKLEVQEAWDNYKQAQEKAAQQESELQVRTMAGLIFLTLLFFSDLQCFYIQQQDEIRQIQKAKLTDKQQSVAQLSKMSEEVAEAMRQVQLAQQHTKDLQVRRARKKFIDLLLCFYFSFLFSLTHT